MLYCSVGIRREGKRDTYKSTTLDPTTRSEILVVVVMVESHHAMLTDQWQHCYRSPVHAAEQLVQQQMTNSVQTLQSPATTLLSL